MDACTAITILELQIQDVDHYLSSRKGKEKAGTTNDHDAAVQLQRDELSQALAILNDRRMCQDIGQAIHNDHEAIAGFKEIESSSFRDRRLAYTLAGQPDRTHTHNEVEADLDADSVVSRFSNMNVFDPDDCGCVLGYGFKDAEDDSSQYFKHRALTENNKLLECVACGEEKPYKTIFTAECSDNYCKGCLTKLFQDAIIDESLFPPRCCRQRISISGVQYLLDPQLIARAERKAIEVDTVDRTYCSRPTCSTFILPEQITRMEATCIECSQMTCVSCKCEAHDGPCRSTQDAEVLALAQDSGWQRCPQCQTIVELSIGCNHIT